MNEIKEFLQILENCVVKYEVLDNGQTRIRSPEELRYIFIYVELSRKVLSWQMKIELGS